jgi:hydroxymethylglutaryl-CoA reductase (NADPH)
MFIPNTMLKQLYTIGSLHEHEDGIVFTLKNRLKDTVINEIKGLSINKTPIAPENIQLRFAHSEHISGAELKQSRGIEFPLGAVVEVQVAKIRLQAEEKNLLDIELNVADFGDLHLKVEDQLSLGTHSENDIPRNPTDDLQPSIIAARQDYIRRFTNTAPRKLFDFSIDVPPLKGNIEHFSGVAQIPVGIAGPLLVNGEHAKGEFLIPLATTEGTLVASYDRGMKLLNLGGGVSSTIVDEGMQRAPVFVFKNARQGRDFVTWLKENMAQIKAEAEKTDPFVKLTYIDHILAHKCAYLRFNYTTGDAAGQNMVGRATFIACSWILENYADIDNFFLEANLATDKKSSQMNIMRTRGKRVTAEATISKEHLRQVMRVEPEQIDFHGRVSAVGSFLSGTNNTGLHSANAIAAMFIATGQDVANVAESSAALLYSEVDKNGDLYLSVTIPALIVATCGGGTGLGTQRECLELLQCFGANKAHKLAEIIAAVVLAGEISLASAISSLDWVPSHEEYGRN